jgi:hypothetical protein
MVEGSLPVQDCSRPMDLIYSRRADSGCRMTGFAGATVNVVESTNDKTVIVATIV